MDSEEKKRISNEKRLKAIREWKKNQTVQKLKPINTRKILDTDVTHNPKNELQLFESDGENEVEKYEECFSVRPQFEGPHGQELLEMSSQFSGRFKLDERFKEDYDPKPKASEDGEKEKNMKILQSILGYEVLTKTSNNNLSKKRQMRYDPEDEFSSQYMKTSDTAPREKPKRQKKSKDKNQDDKNECDIPRSMECYIEVSSNLKEILSVPSTPFSLAQKFNKAAEPKRPEFEEIYDEPVASYYDVEEKNIKDNNFKDKYDINEKNSSQNLSSSFFKPKITANSFFIKEGDPRLKEGVEFFRRPKPIEEIREEWYAKREYVLALALSTSDKYKAYCTCCKEIELGKMDESAVKMHMNGKKHASLIKTVVPLL